MEVQARGHSQGGLENHGIRNVSAVYCTSPSSPRSTINSYTLARVVTTIISRAGP